MSDPPPQENASSGCSKWFPVPQDEEPTTEAEPIVPDPPAQEEHGNAFAGAGPAPKNEGCSESKMQIQEWCTRAAMETEGLTTDERAGLVATVMMAGFTVHHYDSFKVSAEHGADGLRIFLAAHALTRQNLVELRDIEDLFEQTLCQASRRAHDY